MLKKLFFAVVLILVAIAVSGAVFRPEPETKKVEIEWTVATGDTKWAVVGGLMEQYGDKRDIREVLYLMDKANNIKGHIYPGQKINITLESTKEAN